MKNFTLLSTLLLSLTSTYVLAANQNCKPISGQIERLVPDTNRDGSLACHIQDARSSHFPDLTFLGAPYCFSTTLTATIGTPPARTVAVTGTAYSGLTAFGANQLNAASAISFQNTSGLNLGRIFTQDLIFGFTDSNGFTATHELLTMVSGTNTFNGGHGHLEITGNALAGPATFTGVLCVEY